MNIKEWACLKCHYAYYSKLGTVVKIEGKPCNKMCNEDIDVISHKEGYITKCSKFKKVDKL